MAEAKLLRTKKGNGYKIVVEEVWYYAPKEEVSRLVSNDVKACTFRTIEDEKDETGRPEKQAEPCIEIFDDPDDFDYEETGWTKELHAYQDYLLEHEDRGEK